MRCFYHPDSEAVALCKSCSRGLCHTCAADVEPGTACLDRCEEDVRSLNIVLQRSKSAYQKTGAAYKGNAVFSLSIGTVFVLVGLLPMVMGKGYATAIIALLGLIFILSGINNLRSSRSITSVDE